MSYTFLEKLKVSAYALGSAIATGSSAFAVSTVVGAGSVPFIAVATALATTLGLLHTAHSTFKEIKKNRARIVKIERQDNDQERRREQLQSLKLRIKGLLAKEEKEEEHTEEHVEEHVEEQVEEHAEEQVEEHVEEHAEEIEKQDEKEEGKEKKVTPQKKAAANPAKLATSRAHLAKQEAQAKQVAQAKKDRAAKSRQQAKQFRDKKARINKLRGALKKLEVFLPEDPGTKPTQRETAPEKTLEIILPGVLNTTSLQNEIVPERSLEGNLSETLSATSPESKIAPEKSLEANLSDTLSSTSLQSEIAPENSIEKKANTNRLLEKTIQIGKGVVTGCLKGATTAYGAIHTGAAIFAISPPLVFSPPMLASVVILGVIGAVGNAALSERQWASDLQDEESDARYENTKQLLEKEHDSIIQLLGQLDPVDNNPIEKESEQDKNPTLSLLPRAVAMPETIINISAPSHTAPLAEVSVDILPSSPPSRTATLVTIKPTVETPKISVPVHSASLFADRPTSPPSRSAPSVSKKPAEKTPTLLVPGQSAADSADRPTSPPSRSAPSIRKNPAEKTATLLVPGHSAADSADRPTSPPSRSAPSVNKKQVAKSPRIVPSPRLHERSGQRHSLPTRGDGRLFTHTRRHVPDVAQEPGTTLAV